jgi:molecular chaperone GrpE
MTEEGHEEITPEPETTEENAVISPATVIEAAPPEEVCGEEVSPEEALLAEKVCDLEAQLAEAEKKAAEYLDGWQRSQASMANYRKRVEVEQANWRTVANAALLTRILPVLDDFNRAFSSLPSEFDGHAWLDGLRLIQRKLQQLVESENVRMILVNPGDAFDPLYHQAILYQEVEGFEDGQIVAEVERGYVLGDRVLRPTLVVVAKVPARPSAPEPRPEIEGVEETASEFEFANVVEGEIQATEIIAERIEEPQEPEKDAEPSDEA